VRADVFALEEPVAEDKDSLPFVSFFCGLSAFALEEVALVRVVDAGKDFPLLAFFLSLLAGAELVGMTSVPELTLAFLPTEGGTDPRRLLSFLMVGLVAVLVGHVWERSKGPGLGTALTANKGKERSSTGHGRNSGTGQTRDVGLLFLPKDREAVLVERMESRFSAAPVLVLLVFSSISVSSKMVSTSEVVLLLVLVLKDREERELLLFSLVRRRRRLLPSS